MFCFKPEKTKHKPVLINAIRCCCNSNFSASLLTYTDSTRFWQIWYLSVPLVFADYIYTWTNLNPVINAGSLESAKEDSKTYFAREFSYAAFAIFAPWTNYREFLVLPASFESSRSSSRHSYASVGLWKLLLPWTAFSVSSSEVNLIKRVIPEKLTCNPSLFKVLNIPAGWKLWLYRSSIRVLV